MKFSELPLKGLWLAELEPVRDVRGGFARVFCKNEFGAVGLTRELVQINHSWNTEKGTVRGLHFQVAPFREIKLIRCIRGSVFDVVVDIRRDSPTFLQHHAVELSEKNLLMLYVPEGFAHGFQTLSDDTQLLYHHTEYYRANSEGGLRYNDPALNISWPLPVASVSDRDTAHPLIGSDFKGI